MAETAESVPFLSIVPNEFPAPVVPGDMGLAAVDAAYSMAPYFLGPEEALVITAAGPSAVWPTSACGRAGNKPLITRIGRCPLNRAQTELEDDGSFRIVLAHSDPGCKNWIDTEGRALGLVFWRFFLPEGEIETPQAQVVPFSQL